jgi:uncharacterized peroxidase-related enzyme
MPSIALVDPSQNEFLASLEAKAKQPNPFFRAMAHRPDVLKSFVPLYSAVMGPGAVERRIKALLYLACSYANRCAFCIAANTPGARKAGVTEQELQSLKDEWDDVFSEAERAAIRYARELTRTGDAMATRAALSPHFPDEQIAEMTLVVCAANFTNRFNNALQIQPEA